MISVRSLSKDDWAKYALLVIYAWDMCDLNQDPASNELDPRILADGWRAVGIITGKDNVLATAPSTRQGIPPQNAGLRQSMVGPEEWIDNTVFIAERRTQFPGRVETGFTDIYLSMEYLPLTGGPALPLANGIR